MAINLQAQSSPNVAHVKLETKEDYKNSEDLVMQSIDWVLNTPVTKNASKRKEISAFLINWMSGSPNISVALVEGLTPLDCPDCLVAFMAGWVKYSIENNYSKNDVTNALAGIESAVDFYKKNKSELGKNSELEKLIKHKKKGTLKEYVESKFI